MIIETYAYARAGLLGNPSDGYFGKTISISVRNFGASVLLYQSPELTIEPHNEDLNVFKDIKELSERVGLHGYYGGDRLIKAAIKKFLEYCQKNSQTLENKNFTLRYHSSVPRQVGLAGSSAIITAVMRALCAFYQVNIPEELLPTLILKTETEELGINAGLQDRVIQVYEGCVYMDFNRKTLEEKDRGIYQRLDPSLLPKLFIAYKTELSKVSGQVLGNIRSQYDQGNQEVIDTLNSIADLAKQGEKALTQKDHSLLFKLMNKNFDLRKKIMPISKSNLELVERARGCGACAKFTGSGGSIIGIYKDDDMLKSLIQEMGKIKARVIKPQVI